MHFFVRTQAPRGDLFDRSTQYGIVLFDEYIRVQFSTLGSLKYQCDSALIGSFSDRQARRCNRTIPGGTSDSAFGTTEFSESCLKDVTCGIAESVVLGRVV